MPGRVNDARQLPEDPLIRRQLLARDALQLTCAVITEDIDLVRIGWVDDQRFGLEWPAFPAVTNTTRPAN
jgi:hypothetical protein